MLTVSGSTFELNYGNYGGGIGNHTMLTVTNSTFAGNKSNSSGGGIYADGTLTVINSTLSQNTAYSPGGQGGSQPVN